MKKNDNENVTVGRNKTQQLCTTIGVRIKANKE
jgi:hypothetical protein